MIETFYQSEIVDIDSLKPYDRNYNKHSDRQLGHLSESLENFGQFKNIIAWREFIVAGHGLVLAARARGWKRIEVKRLPDDWDETRVCAVLVADNEIARQSSPDRELLADLMKGLTETNPELISSTGFNDSDFRKLLLDAGAEEVAENDGVPIQWLIMIECANEEQQLDYLKRFMEEGIQCRALVS